MDANIAWSVLRCFYLMIPAYLANMAPVIVKKIDFLAYPLDFSKKLDGQPVLGKNKTFRGFFFAIIFGIAGAFIQYYLSRFEFFRSLSFLDYSRWLLIGFLMGFGAIVGDAIKSFFKRRVGIKPGHKFVPFDQTDFVIGAMIFLTLIFDMSFKLFLTSLAMSFFLHIIVNHIAYFLRIRNEKW